MKVYAEFSVFECYTVIRFVSKIGVFMWSFVGNTLVSGAYFCHHVSTGAKDVVASCQRKLSDLLFL